MKTTRLLPSWFYRRLWTVRLAGLLLTAGAAPVQALSLKTSLAVPAVRPLAAPLGPLGAAAGARLIAGPSIMAAWPAPVLPRVMPRMLPGVPASELARLPVEGSRAAGQAVMDRVLAYSLADIKAGAHAKSSKKMPDPEPKDERGNGEDLSDLDELGNPRRRGGDGPDDVSDEFSGGGRGNSDLF